MLEDSMALPGQTYYAAGAVQFDDGSTRSILQIDRSLLTRLSLTAGIVSNNLNMDNTADANASVGTTTNPILTKHSLQNFYNVGVRTYFDSIFLSADEVTNNEKGSLSALSVKTKLWNSTVTLTQALLQDFTSEEFLPSNDPIVSQSKARIDMFIPFLQNLPVSFEGKNSVLESGNKLLETSLKVSSYFNGISFSNRIRQTSSGGYDTTTDEFQMSGRIGSYSLRGGLSYEIAPQPATTSVDLSGNIKINREYNFTQSISSQLLSNEIRFEAGLNKEVGKYGLGLRGGGTNQGEVFIGLRVNVALGVEPRHSDFFTSAQAMATTGAVSARAFLDKNVNGIFDEDDVPLSNIGFRSEGAILSARTDDRGIALVTHLPTSQRLNFGIDKSTIDDPQITPALNGVRLLPRSGKISEIEFPCTFTTEIDGTVTVDAGGLKNPAGEIELQLVQFLDHDQVVSETKTAYDGYYIFPSVPPGQYILRVEPEQAKRIHADLFDLKVVKVLPNSNFINGLDLTLKLPIKNSVVNFETKAKNADLDSDKSDRYSFYVILGSFALEKSYVQVLAQLRKFDLPALIHPFKTYLKVYRLQTIFEDKTIAIKFKHMVSKYGYHYAERPILTKTEVYVGPYYSSAEAAKDKSILAAANPSSAIAITSDTEPIDMTELAVGSFDTYEQAKNFATEMKKLNSTEISIQKRRNGLWIKPQ